jgi:RNA polymerase sigma factor (TIGR02999 family)
MTPNRDDDQPGAAELTPIVYRELRQIAAAYLRRERPGQTLQATALVHEAYLRLAGAGTPWRDERHFVGIAARSMRQILVYRARARGAQNDGPNWIASRSRPRSQAQPSRSRCCPLSTKR